MVHRGVAVVAGSRHDDVRVERPVAVTVTASDRETGAILFLGAVHDPHG